MDALWRRLRGAWFWIGERTDWWPQRVLAAVAYLAALRRLTRKGRRRR